MILEITVKPYEEEINILPIMKAGEDLEETIVEAECECCGLREECTREYVSRTRRSFSGKWVCGLCTEVVKEKIHRSPVDVEEAMIDHKNFVQDFNTKTRLNPKLSFAWAMRDIAKKNCDKRRTSSCVPRID